MNKQCKTCLGVKALTDFYKQPQCVDGRVGECKTCTKERIKINRLRKLDYYRAYDKRRNKNPSRVVCKRAYNVTYSKDKFNANQIARRWHPIKKPCVVCGCMDSERHHPDYSKPRDIVWLCKPHHRQVHVGTLYVLTKFTETGVRPYSIQERRLLRNSLDSVH